MRLITIMLSLFTALWLGGCQTTNDALRDKGSGTTQVYPVSTNQAWDIARTVFRWEGTDAIEEHREEGYMITSSGVNAVSWGTVMVAWIDAAGNDSSSVTVVTKRRMATNVFTTLTESTFHNRFGQAVRIVKSGQKLPVTPPTSTP